MLSRTDKESSRFIKVLVDLGALTCQATGFVVWPLLDAGERPRLWVIPIAAVCISCGWWENYINKQSHIGKSPPIYA